MTVEEGFPQHGVGAEIWLQSFSKEFVPCSLLSPFHHIYGMARVPWWCFKVLISMFLIKCMNFCSMSVVEESFDYLDAPIERISGADIPMPYAANLERIALPQVCILIFTFVFLVITFYIPWLLFSQLQP